MMSMVYLTLGVSFFNVWRFTNWTNLLVQVIIMLFNEIFNNRVKC